MHTYIYIVYIIFLRLKSVLIAKMTPELALKPQNSFSCKRTFFMPSGGLTGRPVPCPVSQQPWAGGWPQRQDLESTGAKQGSSVSPSFILLCRPDICRKLEVAQAAAETSQSQHPQV